MELKFITCSCLHCSSAGFNRTFMELKLINAPFRLSARKFQSYLYGIEMKVNLYLSFKSPGFNRTFMELKFTKCMKVTAASFLFQSYLYGIEMEQLKVEYQKILKFQSYLYGIEIENGCIGS